MGRELGISTGPHSHPEGRKRLTPCQSDPTLLDLAYKMRMMTIKELEAKSGVSHGVIYGITSGTHSPNFFSVVALANTLGYDIILVRRDGGR